MVAMSDYASNGGTAKSNYGWYFANSGEDAPIGINRSPYTSYSKNGSNANYPVITLAAITKGTASTVLLGEKCVNAEKVGMQFQDDDDGWIAGWDCDTTRWGMVPPIPDYHNATEQEQGNGLGSAYDEQTNYAFGSAHSGGSNLAMCDGSVRPINYNINPLVFEYLCSRNPASPKADPLLQQSLQNGTVSLRDVSNAGF